MNSGFSGTLVVAVDYFFNILYALIFIRVILSWIPTNARANPLIGVIYTVTDPILNPLRRMLQNSPLGGRGMMLDFSPIFAMFLMNIAKTFIISLIIMLSARA